MKVSSDSVDGPFRGNNRTPVHSFQEQLKVAYNRLQNRLESFLQETHDAVISTTASGHIIEWNENAQNLLGWKKEAILGEKLGGIVVPPRYRVAHETFLKDLLTDGCETYTNKIHEIEALHRDGHEIPVQVSVFREGLGESSVFHLFARSLEDRKNVDKLKDKFISTVSHEVRTPLSIVNQALNNLCLELGDQLNEKQWNMLDVAMKNGRRLTQVILNLLDLSKLESGEIICDFQKIKFINVVEEVIHGYKFEAHQKGMAFLEDFKPDIYVLELEADIEMLMQLLNNLLSNAVRFGKEKVQFKIRSDRYWLYLTVTDDGVGIEASKVDQIFNKFVQIDRPEGGSGYFGTGMGLSIVKRLVQLHHGHIWIESQPNHGTAVHVKIPLAQL